MQLCAITDCVGGRGTTHVFVQEDDSGAKEILGFITLRASALTKQSDGTMQGEAALEIAELAVGQNAERRGIGSDLVKFAIIKAAELNQTCVGFRYILLCADEKAVPFYEKLGFARLDEYGEIPREGWNANCTPMFLRLYSE